MRAVWSRHRALRAHLRRAHEIDAVEYRRLFGLHAQHSARDALGALDARLDVAEIEFSLQERADGIEEGGADEAENGVAEVERDPGSDEQEAE